MKMKTLTSHLVLAAAAFAMPFVCWAHPPDESGMHADEPDDHPNRVGFGVLAAQPGQPRRARPNNNQPGNSQPGNNQPGNQPGNAPGVDANAAPMEAITLPAATVTITIEGSQRIVRANGLPNHATGMFPNPGNPNALRPQSHEYKIPLVPTIASEPISARPEFGIGINGVIFDSGTAEFWSAQGRVFGGGSMWNYEALTGGIDLGIDMNNAHVQPTGKYHYHGIPTGLVSALKSEQAQDRMMHLGWAFDGFPIYGPWGYSDPADAKSPVRKLKSSYRVKTGSRPESPEGPGGKFDGTFGNDWEYVKGLGDLDECNGRYGVTPEFPQGTFYYVLTEEFPSVPRLWKGEPDASLRQRGPGGGPEGGPPGGGGQDAGPPNGGPRSRPRGPRPQGGGQNPPSTQPR